MRRPKYGAIRTTALGRKFDSKAEAARYLELRLLEKAGKVTSLQCQPEWKLHVGQVCIGKYRADFAYVDGQQVVFEDVKGYKTPLYRWKKKHVEAEYGVAITEVSA